jgi:hypothetical protein
VVSATDEAPEHHRNAGSVERLLERPRELAARMELLCPGGMGGTEFVTNVFLP